MSACTFSFSFTALPKDVLAKAKKSVESQSGTFNGNENEGSFSLSIFGNTIAGGYTVAGNMFNVVILEKPFMVPCAAIESFLSKQIAG